MLQQAESQRASRGKSSLAPHHVKKIPLLCIMQANVDWRSITSMQGRSRRLREQASRGPGHAWRLGGNPRYLVDNCHPEFLSTINAGTSYNSERLEEQQACSSQ
jgi:hypothetical protein